ncbi:MAG: electron transfer flavoprotein subunit beta/FixA family protein [Flavobacteriales bacterium]|nr:electron transfer flavoprotein subunit beta/FixA family protein [Flavobacteriales bacterium]
MKLLVCISKAPDTTSRIAFTDGDKRFDESGVQFIVNPYDEWYALVRAIELVEQNGGSVTTITVGDATCDPIVRKALAIGASDAVRIDAVPTDSSQVARLIANYAQDQGYDIILGGKETIDNNSSAVPAMIAECLDLPYVALVTKLDMSGDEATLTAETTGGTNNLSVKGTFVMSATKGIAEQRIPNMRGIMSARTKQLQVVEASAVEISTHVDVFKLPAPKGDCVLVDADNPEELVRILREEAKII